MIFDRKKLGAHRDRAAENLKYHDVLIKYAADDIVDRLNHLDKEFHDILDLGCRHGYLTKLLQKQHSSSKVIATDLSTKMLESFEHDGKFHLDEENISSNLEFIGLAKFDLITFSLGLNWINDIQFFFKMIYGILKPDGLFIGNFVGGNSLKNLRLKLIEAELNSEHPHSAHISPFIHFDHITPLLQQAGFLEIIVDYENIELDYESPIALMKQLRNMGESNALNKSANYSISKKMLQFLSTDTELFTDQINLISFISSPLKNTIKIRS